MKIQIVLDLQTPRDIDDPWQFINRFSQWLEKNVNDYKVIISVDDVEKIRKASTIL